MVIMRYTITYRSTARGGGSVRHSVYDVINQLAATVTFVEEAHAFQRHGCDHKNVEIIPTCMETRDK